MRGHKVGRGLCAKQVGTFHTLVAWAWTSSLPPMLLTFSSGLRKSTAKNTTIGKRHRMLPGVAGVSGFEVPYLNSHSNKGKNDAGSESRSAH